MTKEDMKKMHNCTWKNILLRIRNLKSVNLNLPNILQVSIGDGKGTSFWEDKWLELGILKNIFPRLYALELDKKVKVKNRITTNLENWERRRAIREGRERSEAAKMEEEIKNQVISNKEDKWTIPGAPNGKFSTAWFRDCMETHKIMGQISQNFWNKWIPKKHNIFIWRLIRKGIPTRSKLSEMGTLQENNDLATDDFRC